MSRIACLLTTHERLTHTQAIALDKQCRRLVGDYLEVWRPLVTAKEVVNNDKLFLNSNGNPVQDFSHVLSILWQSSFSKQMSITALRYWKATKLALAATTPEERDRILKGDAHSDKVSRKHYEKVWRVADASLAKSDSDRVCNLTSFDRPDSDCVDDDKMDDKWPRAGGKKRKNPWSISDTKLLLDNYENFQDAPDKWVRLLDFISPRLQCKTRSGTSLKDRYRWCQRNPEKVKQTNNKQQP